jgi:hypothetical protein
MKNKIKYFSSLIVFGLFILFAIASGDEKIKWEPNNKSIFCGQDFYNSDYIEQISMDIKSKTILNCDGTFESSRGWEAVGGEKTIQGYRTTVGRSSDEEYNFTGTWEIIEPTENLKGDHSFDKLKPTYVKFKSSNGITGYSMIVCTNYNGSFQLRLIRITENGGDIWFENEHLTGMFSGEINSHNVENKIN